MVQFNIFIVNSQNNPILKIVTTMKIRKFAYILAIISAAFLTVSCSSDSDSFDPYQAQEKIPLYPSKMTFRSATDNATTQEDWTFKYNSDNTIKSYNCKQTIKKNDGLTITETTSGKIDYYTDFNSNRRLVNTIYVSYKSSKGAAYKDTITENVTFLGDYISRIEIMKKHNQNGKSEISSYERNFTYSQDYCIGSSIRDTNNETTYTYRWSGECMIQATIHNQSINGSNLTHDTYEYTYNNREVVSDNGFNPLAFVYGHNPKIYAAMGFFGKTTPYKLETLSYNGYEKIDGRQYPLQSYILDYSINEIPGSILEYSAVADNYLEYSYTFRK